MQYIEMIDRLEELDESVKEQAKKRTDSLMKPLGSLGYLEALGIQLAGITGSVKNTFDRCATIIMAADNGICKEGVASAPKEITRIQTENMAKGITGISALSKANGADVCIIDIGVDGDCIGKNILSKKVRNGTDSFLHGPAMTMGEAKAAIHVGIEAVEELKNQGYLLLGTGEMGIGNTSTATAVICALLSLDPKAVTGRGAGLTNEAYLHKVDIISEGLKNNDLLFSSKNRDVSFVLDVLSKVGGLDICGLAGCYIACAYYRIPVIVDGVISIAAALAAYYMNPVSASYMIPSHASLEPAYQAAANVMGLRPPLNLQMRLGEGSGCPIMYRIIQSACACMNDIASFDELKIDDTFLVDNR